MTNSFLHKLWRWRQPILPVRDLVTWVLSIRVGGLRLILPAQLLHTAPAVGLKTLHTAKRRYSSHRIRNNILPNTKISTTMEPREIYGTYLRSPVLQSLVHEGWQLRERRQRQQEDSAIPISVFCFPRRYHNAFITSFPRPNRARNMVQLTEVPDEHFVAGQDNDEDYTDTGKSPHVPSRGCYPQRPLPLQY